MKRILCIGRVRNGGPVEIRPTLEERLDAAIAHTAEVLAMSRDLEDMLAGRTKPTTTWSDADQEACDEERLGSERGWW